MTIFTLLFTSSPLFGLNRLNCRNKDNEQYALYTTYKTDLRAKYINTNDSVFAYCFSKYKNYRYCIDAQLPIRRLVNRARLCRKSHDFNTNAVITTLQDAIEEETLRYALASYQKHIQLID
jgi:hypothetical protein